MSKLKGLRDDGSIDAKALQSDEDIYRIVDYLIEVLKECEDCILERKGDRITWISSEKPNPVVITVSNLKGSDRANFLNSTGIIRRYNQQRKNGQEKNGKYDGYPEIGSEIDIGGIRGYGFSPGTRGIVQSYKFYPNDNRMYVEIKTSRGVIPIPVEMLNDYSFK
ncbi:MAG: hypothetical protein QXM68_01035 [Candidatus Aenigmatarchaeota archaeon]|nr:hypothetical protein [Candidatus Aenigmarchaeota archaeon]